MRPETATRIGCTHGPMPLPWERSLTIASQDAAVNSRVKDAICNFQFDTAETLRRDVKLKLTTSPREPLGS